MSKHFERNGRTDTVQQVSADKSALDTSMMQRNYMTPKGYADLQEELSYLLKTERPKLVEVVAWAASNGDRSENGDYIYGKKKLREIDRRLRFLHKRLEKAVVVHPEDQTNQSQIFFGAKVMVWDEAEEAEFCYQIVGVDEANASDGKISWVSPLAKALLKASEGDVVKFASPKGMRELEVVEIKYN